MGSTKPQFQGVAGPFPGNKKTGCEFDISLSSTTEVKNKWRYKSTALYTFVARTVKKKYCLHFIYAKESILLLEVPVI
jgi:hypothetical protein